jgi:nucleotide-binding universal stress UspA family protein
VSDSRASFKRMLVPVDFSLRSANALQFAVAFGSRWHAQIEVLHVWHSDLATGVTVAKERARNTLREFVASLELRGDVALRRRTEHGDPYLTIQRLLQLGGHDLVVLAGSESQRATDDSVAKSLLSSAPCSVLFVPPNSRMRRRSDEDRTLDLERLLVPLALAGEGLEALDCAEALASSEHATIEVLSTSDASPAFRARLQARAPLAARTGREEQGLSCAAMQQRTQVSPFDLVILCGKRAGIGGHPDDDRALRVALSQPYPTLCLPG